MRAITITGRSALRFVRASAMTLVGTFTVICVLVTDAGVSVFGPICAVAPAVKPVPVSVIVNAGPVAVTVFGLIRVSVSGSVTVRVSAFEVIPPGLVTDTETSPG